MVLVLWLIAAILVVLGIIKLLGGSILFGLLLIILGFGIGPGGWTIYNRGRA